MRTLSLVQAIANQRLRCSLCAYVIQAGEMFWRGQVGEAHRDVLWLCTAHIPLNARGMIIEESDDGSGITYVRPDAVNVRRDLIPRLLQDSHAIYCLTPEEFEELVFDRLIAMDLQAFRMGPANRKDGGIDIVFWAPGVIPILGAVQVKHRRSPKAKVRAGHVRDFAGAMEGRRFNVGVIITNTSFTDDAIHRAKAGSVPIQLRDGQILHKWLTDDFAPDMLSFETQDVEYCKGENIRMPYFL